MSGRRSGRLAAVTALLALVMLAGGIAGLDSGVHQMDFDWGAPVGAVATVSLP
ncbi:hypothetical protein OG799_32125 [Micromonospora sp. NBC_00898]|uniref:hypothetical protein n=1 Tax=Micromonospora sp. NBC_00898 TaxID=2975981 RepID=UPI00386C22D5|nr:hypothetical protein OG799_32125 [Micromonospora sp. NBC_00898]